MGDPEPDEPQENHHHAFGHGAWRHDEDVRLNQLEKLVSALNDELTATETELADVVSRTAANEAAQDKAIADLHTTVSDLQSKLDASSSPDPALVALADSLKAQVKALSDALPATPATPATLAAVAEPAPTAPAEAPATAPAVPTDPSASVTAPATPASPVTPAAEPVSKPLYEHTNGAAFDTAAWPTASVKGADGRALYNFNGDTGPTATGVSDGWAVYTGPTIPA